MSDEQFSELMLKMNMHNGHMNYMDFILNFGDPRHPDASQGVVEHLKNHRVNPIRGDEYGMSVAEVETKLHQKLRENFTVSMKISTIFNFITIKKNYDFSFYKLYF